MKTLKVFGVAQLGAAYMVAASLVTFAQNLRGEAEETEQVDRTIAFPAAGTLQLHNFSGDVQITGTDRKDVVVKAVRRATRDRLDHIALDIQISGSTVTIQANKRDPGWRNPGKSDVVETSFEIEVPASANINVDVFSSNLNISGVAGAQRLKTFSGKITVDASAAGPTPRLIAETFSGSIRARLAESVTGDVEHKSFSGSFDTELPLNLRSTNRKRERAAEPTVGEGNSPLRFKTFSGSVQLIK
ncbi:MAG: hypothetical protein L0Z50_24570 [Verrucomicrobiales bacterium]|nr:hypothetical protein [Verrucomicrobiales bacterium]